jgi:response regulator of citrate/malate metabolism
MPDGIGLVLLDLLRVHSPECVVIVITACADETLLASAQASSGVRAVLAKPIEMPTLLRTISSIGQ